MLQPTEHDKKMVFIDGENISTLDISYVAHEFASYRKLIYQTDRSYRKRGYPGFEHVIPPRMGKETVDKVIGMDIVDAYYSRHCREVALVSNDHDFAATAIHLRRRLPDLKIHIYCDPARVSQTYVAKVRDAGIGIRFMEGEDPELDLFACRVIEVIRELHNECKLTLPNLGAALRERGIEYKKLKQDLVQHGVLLPGSSEGLNLTQVAMKRVGGEAPKR